MAVQTSDAPATMRGAIFEAFRKRERTGVLATAAMGLLTALVAILCLFFTLYQEPLAALHGWQADLAREATPDPAAPAPPAMPQLPPAFFVLLPGYLGVMFFVYVALAAFEAACLRWMLRGETEGLFFGLNLGADTWRVYLGYWIWFGCGMSTFYASVFVSLLLGGLAAGVAAVAGYGSSSSDVGLLVGALAFVIAGSVLAWAAVNLAPAAATSVEKRRFAFFEAWKMSRGRFWPILGSFALVLVPYYVLLIAIEFALLAVILGDLTAEVGGMAMDYKAMTAKLLRPEMIAVLGGLSVLMIALMFVVHIMTIGINARAVMAARALNPSGAA